MNERDFDQLVASVKQAGADQARQAGARTQNPDGSRRYQDDSQETE